jgi:uncharacterized protein
VTAWMAWGQGAEPSAHELLPQLTVARFVDLDFAHPAARGFDRAILDVDNTLAVTHGELLPGVAEHLARARREGLVRAVCLVSNCMLGAHRVQRLQRLAESLDATWVAADWRAPKPSPLPFRRALTLLGCKASQVVVVGDQLYTDVRGGNRLGMYTVWVKPHGPDHWTTAITLRRWREARLLKQHGLWP